MAIQFNNFKATRPKARLKDPKNRTYEAFFIVYDLSGKKYPIRFSRDVNNRPFSDRLPQARAIASVLWEALLGGWNPLVTKYPRFPDNPQLVKTFTFSQAIAHGAELKRKILSKYSMYDYDGCVRFMTAAAGVIGIDKILITEVKKTDIRSLVCQAKEDHNWSNRARNKYLTILRSILGALVDNDIIEYNPAGRIKLERQEETIGYVRLTNQEKEAIASHLLTVAPDFFEYLMMIYDDGIRRTEALQLRVSDVNLGREEIRIRADVAKTNKERIVPITPTIKQILLNREIWKWPPDHFIFSSNKFRPGPGPFHPNTPTNWWKKLVQGPPEHGGLGIACKMYSLKHKGADDKIEAGIDLDVLKTLYGHRSSQMTEIYARAIREKYKQKIIDNAPAFAKVVDIRRKAK